MATPSAAASPQSSPRAVRKRAFVDAEAVDVFFERFLNPDADIEALRAEARKLQRRQEPDQFTFSTLLAVKAYTLETIGITAPLQALEMPAPPFPSREVLPWLTQYLALVTKYWHVDSSENTTHTIIDAILLAVLEQLPDGKKLNVWGEVDVSRSDGFNVYGAIAYVLGAPSLSDTPAGRYVIVVEANKALGGHDRVQAFDEMKAALERNKKYHMDVVYGVLTDATRWRILSLSAELVPRMSCELFLTTDPKYAGQLCDLINVLYAVFLMAQEQNK